MTRRRDLERHRGSLDEIGEIMDSMKTLAYMETRKLGRFIAAQRLVVESIAAAAEDFRRFHPEFPAAAGDATPVLLVIGAERGFCGDFNRKLVERMTAAMQELNHPQPQVIAVGHKLRSLLERGESVAAFVNGASVAEDVPAVLQSLIGEIDALKSRGSGLTLFGIYHDDSSVCFDALLPPFQQRADAVTAHRCPPLLNVPPQAFLLDLVDHYLFAALNHMVYASLMAENQRRVSHLEGAVRHIESQSEELKRRCQSARQEEITEEIEVILLSAASLNPAGGDGG